MEVDEIQAQACKFPRIGNGGRANSNKIAHKGGSEKYPDEEDDGELRRAGGAIDNGGNRLRGWNASRIIRVSRASGGKDRHSKVWTSKGLRDRRVRLSVTTAIQFYDLQDRLRVDQPSKAVEWLINAAADAIAELPSLNGSFPDTPKQMSDEKRGGVGNEQGFDSAEIELDGEANLHQNQQQNQHLSLSKSACSSTSETSKGSGLSLSRSEMKVNRDRARERARERAAKEKEKENESSRIGHHQNMNNSISQNSTFTELLTAGIGNVNNSNSSPTASVQQNPAAAMPNDYFGAGLLGLSSSRTHHSSGFSGQIHMGHSLQQTMSIPPYGVSGDNHAELPHFSFLPDHFIPVATTSQPNGGDYNLSFSISSGLAGYNRGTLQSNSPSLLPHLQRFSTLDGTNLPFFIGAASAAQPMENHHHHQFPAGFDGRQLQLCHGDGSRISDHKGKGKN